MLGMIHNASPIYKIHVTYDPEAAMFVALSDDIPGLATEARTIPDLIARVHEIAPELLELNDDAVAPEYLAFKTEDIYVPYISSGKYHG